MRELINQKAVVYLPTSKRHKTTVRGFWKDSEGKTCYDYIYKRDVYGLDTDILDSMLEMYKQDSIFYTVDKAHIYNGKEFINLDTRRETFVSKHNREGLRFYIKNLVKRLGGCTVYTNPSKDYYTIEYWF